MLVFIEGINFPHHMGYFHMLGYELSSHELVPLPFSIPFEKKNDMKN